ncbi:MAG: Trk system potassium transporter TrkA [Parvibaculales bacterium]
MKVIVCGAGQVGFGIARHLAGEGNDVTVVDREASLMQRITDTLDVRPILGHGGHPDVLEQAGAADADVLIAVTATDEVNMVTCQVAKTLFGIDKTIARVRDANFLKPRWSRLFADEAMPIDVIISPEQEVAAAVLRRLALPGAFDSASFFDGQCEMIGISIGEDCPVVDTPLNQLTGLFPDLQAIVVGIRRDRRTYVPDFDDVIQPGDEAFLVTASSDTERTLKIFGHEEREARRIALIGGGNIGFEVAKALDAQAGRYALSVIEASPERARFVSEKLSRSIVLQGSGLTPEILNEAGVRETDLLLALTNDDQVNVLTTMLALQEGCQRGLCLINDNSFQNLVGQFGMELAVNPRAVTVSSILGQVRRGNVSRVHAISDESAEVLEAQIADGSPIAGTKLRDLQLGDAMRIGMIFRKGEMVMPRGGVELKSGDRVVMFVLADGIDQFESLLRSKDKKPAKKTAKA